MWAIFVDINNREIIDVVLLPDISTLSEIVIVGYGGQSRKKITSSVSSGKSEDIRNAALVSLDNVLQGRAQGVQVIQGFGQPGGAITVRVRGASSVSGGSDPLYVVDGIPINGNSVDQLDNGGSGTNPLATINPSDIKSIEVLKDVAATSIYGTRGANGVILVTTKKAVQEGPKFSLTLIQAGNRLLINYLKSIRHNTETMSPNRT